LVIIWEFLPIHLEVIVWFVDRYLEKYDVIVLNGFWVFCYFLKSEVTILGSAAVAMELDLGSVLLTFLEFLEVVLVENCTAPDHELSVVCTMIRVNSLLVRTDNDVIKHCSEGAERLHLSQIFHSWCLIKFYWNEGVHWIHVDEDAGDGVAWITEGGLVYLFVNTIFFVKAGDFEEDLPRRFPYLYRHIPLINMLFSFVWHGIVRFLLQDPIHYLSPWRVWLLDIILEIPLMSKPVKVIVWKLITSFINKLEGNWICESDVFSWPLSYSYIIFSLYPFAFLHIVIVNFFQFVNINLERGVYFDEALLWIIMTALILFLSYLYAHGWNIIVTVPFWDFNIN